MSEPLTVVTVNGRPRITSYRRLQRAAALWLTAFGLPMTIIGIHLMRSNSYLACQRTTLVDPFLHCHRENAELTHGRGLFITILGAICLTLAALVIAVGHRVIAQWRDRKAIDPSTPDFIPSTPEPRQPSDRELAAARSAAEQLHALAGTRSGKRASALGGLADLLDGAREAAESSGAANPAASAGWSPGTAGTQDILPRRS